MAVLLSVHPYGTYNKGARTPAEMRGLDEYLLAVMDLVSLHAYQIKAIFVTGGVVDSQGVLESASMAQEIERRIKALGLNIPVLDENDLSAILPRSTIGVVEHTLNWALSSVFEQRSGGPLEVWQTTDKVRQFKTWVITRLYLWRHGVRLPVKVIGLQRQDPDNWLSSYLVQFLEIILILFFYRGVRQRIETVRRP